MSSSSAARLPAALVFTALAFACGCSYAPGPSEQLGSSASALDANDQAAYDYFVGQGLTSYQAAGIVGNLDQESGDDPTISQYGGGPGRGIAQWSAGGRWDTDANDNVVWYAGTKGASPESLSLQLEFIWYELTTFSNYGLAELRAATSVTDATVAFETYYEGCGTCDQSNRISYAEAALAAYGSSPPPAPAQYAAAFVSQSFPLASTTLTMFAGQTTPSYIEMKNTGAATWDSSTHLGTTEPRDRSSAFADSTWLSPNRAAGVSGTVAPGGTYRFAFDLHAPATPGNYLEYFNLVQDGVAWFSDPGQGGPVDNDLEANITVVAGVRGSLDAASCSAIAGWTQDQAAASTSIAAELAFDAPAGQTGAGSLSFPAATSRSDLCTAIGSCDHGFSVPVPAALLDGKAHTVYAYGLANDADGPNVLLPGSPKTFTCAAGVPLYNATTGIKRHVADPTSFSAWHFTSLAIAPETPADVAAYPTGAPLPETPNVVIATGDPAVWVIDGTVRRHVIDPTSLAAWALSVTTTTADVVDGYPQGADWPAAPFLIQGAGDPAVYVLDVAPGTSPVDAGVFDAGVAPAPGSGGGGGTHHARDAGKSGVVLEGGIAPTRAERADDAGAGGDASVDGDALIGSGGCSAGGRSDGSWPGALLGLLGALLLRRRRRSRT